MAERWVLSFNGADNHVAAASPVNEITLTGQYEVEFWFLAQGVTAQQQLFTNVHSSANRLAMNINNGELRAGHYDGVSYQGKRSAIIQANTWYHVRYVYHDRLAAMFLNEEPVLGTNSPSTGATAGLRVGRTTTDTMPFGGYIFDVRVSTDDVPILHWPIDVGRGGTANDTVGSNNGTISGATWAFVDTPVGEEPPETVIAGLAPTELVGASNLRNSIGSQTPLDLALISDDPADHDAHWWMAIDPNQPTPVRWRWTPPDAELTGTQEFRVLLRKPLGTAARLVTISVWQGETEIGTADSEILVDSDEGTLITISRETEDFVEPGAPVEIAVVTYPVS